MPHLKTPNNIEVSIDAHKKWMTLLREAETLLVEDSDLQAKAAKGLWLRERALPPEVLGRHYAVYCDVINRMYDSYLNSVHLQRAPYMLHIISVFWKRLYELRNELVHLIVNDYIYVDESLSTLKKTPFDIQIVIPYHYPLESRSDGMGQLLQEMWAEAERRKNAAPEDFTKNQLQEESGLDTSIFKLSAGFQSVPQMVIKESEPTIIPEEFIYATIIQAHERYRQYFIEDFIAKCNTRRVYFAENVEEAPVEIRNAAATLIQSVYRRYMEVKRRRLKDHKRDVMMGIVPDPFRKGLDFEEENNKMYERKRMIRTSIQEKFLMEKEREMVRLIVFKKDNQIEDITDQVVEWLKEWYYGYGYFPEYPYDIEGGTVMVIRGDYPTVDEKIEEDNKYEASMKGKTKEMLKAEKKQAKADALLKEAAAREIKRREAEQLLKLRLNPLSDPGYQPQQSQFMNELVEALQKYRAAWSIYDEFPPDKCPSVIFGYMQTILTEDLMCQLHVDCRKYVDELMRLDLKLLIKAQQDMFKRIGKKYPKIRPRKKPKAVPFPKPLKFNDSQIQVLFDLNIISKPDTKLKDVYGDLSFGNYEMNVRDPDAKFPPPGYGDVRRRLALSCVFGSGIERGPARNKAVMLLGPARNGKSFLIDAVCGELNAVKIDITLEGFSAVVASPAKALADVLLAARVFQPSVIYMRNIERVFAKKIPQEEKYLKAKALIGPLAKLVKQMLPEDKIIFIATCSTPLLAKAKPMMALFDEILLIPRTDYGSLRAFFYEKFQRIRSMPRDYCVLPLAQVFQGYGFGVITEVFDKVMTAERIVRLNTKPLALYEFLQPLFEMEIEATSLEVYKEYADFFIQNSPLSKDREEYEVINKYRALVYQKLAKEKKKKQKT